MPLAFAGCTNSDGQQGNGKSQGTCGVGLFCLPNGQCGGMFYTISYIILYYCQTSSISSIPSFNVFIEIVECQLDSQCNPGHVCRDNVCKGNKFY